MVLFDLLEPLLGTNTAFVIMYSPVGLMVVGVLSLEDNLREGLSKWLVEASRIAAVVVLGWNAFAAWHVGTSPPRPDATLIWIGIAVGTVCSLVFLSAAGRALRRRGPRN